MGYSRRRFLKDSTKTVGTLGILASPLASQLMPLAAKAASNLPYRGTVPVLQGLTNKTSAQFIILTPAEKFYGYQILDSENRLLKVTINHREARPYSMWAIEKIAVDDLQLDISYRLQIIDPASGKVIDERFFKALNTEASKAKFIAASCVRDSYAESREVMWDAMAAAKADLILINGDTCYADDKNDGGTESEYWRRYCETRTLISHFRQKNLTPTLAVWDDHDYGKNNGDSAFDKKDMMKDLFQLFWGNELRPELQKGPGVSQVFACYGQRFFMMDSRYYRSPDEKKRNPQQWGDTQESFLFEKLEQNDDPVWLINGSQFFGGYHKKDSFEYKQPENLNEICGKLSQVSAPVVLISGDVHYSEIMKLEPEIFGYPSYEFTSSSVHSSTPILGMIGKNRRRMVAETSHNFMLFEAENKGSAGWQIRCQSLGKKLKQYFNETLVVKKS